MDVQLLKQADVVLSKCGRPVAPLGMSAVCLYRGIPIQAVFPVTPASASQTITREISGDTTFLLRAISTTSRDVLLRASSPGHAVSARTQNHPAQRNRDASDGP